MRKTLITLLLILSAAASALAANATATESAITGTVLDKADGKALAFATVGVMGRDSTLIAGTICDESGKYSITGIPSGSHLLTYSLMGYKTVTSTFDASGDVTELPPVYLEPDFERLNAAVVGEHVKLVEMKADKLVMNIAQSSFASGSDALELIKKAPGVTVDKDGNVKLNGKTVSVWIDGRPSHMDGKSLEALLRSTNGESIDKFELMEHPSSKYDAEGQGGIINIKTKKNAISGFNGTLGATGGGMYFKENGLDRFPWQESLWANLALRTAKTNTWINVYEGIHNSDLIIENKSRFETSDARSIEQDAYTLFANQYRFYNIKIGNDWFIDQHNTAGLIFHAPGSQYDVNSLSSNTTQRIDGIPSGELNSILNNGSGSRQYNLNANFTHIFDEARSAELTANVDYYHNSTSSRNEQKDKRVEMPGLPPYASSKDIDTRNLYDISSVKVDYQSIVAGKYMLEAGGKWALSTIDSDTEENSNTEENGSVHSIYARNSFSYDEHVAAIYSTIAGQITPRFTAKLGLRGEYTHALGSWEDASPLSYFDVFPTAYLSYVLGKKTQLYLNYSRRISRPDYSQLDPTKTYIDATSWVVGNPQIKPQYSDDVTLGLRLGQHFSLNFGYNHEKDEILQLPEFYDDGTKSLIWGNYGRQQLAYAAVSASAVPLAKWLEWTMSANAIYTDSYSPDYEGFRNNGWCCQAYTDFTFTLPRDWKIDWDAYLSTPMKYGIYKIDSRFNSDIAVKKTLLDGKMTLSIDLHDVFRTNTNNLEIIDPKGETYTVINQRFNTQKLLVNITWSFGKAQQTKARKVGNLEEISRVGSGQGTGISGK